MKKIVISWKNTDGQHRIIYEFNTDTMLIDVTSMCKYGRMSWLDAALSARKTTRTDIGNMRELHSSLLAHAKLRNGTVKTYQ